MTMVVKTLKGGTWPYCNKWRGIFVIPVVAKAISFCIDRIYTLRIIVEQCAEFTSTFHSFFIDFEKIFYSINR